MGYANVLIKPASSLCNMRCRYCFYADESEHRMQKSMGIMTAETSRQLIDAMFTAAGSRGAVNFSFQGGEPTMAGLDFFREFVAMARERNRENLPVNWAMQTNGLNLNGEWAEFLKENGARSSDLGYMGYPKSICTSINDVVPLINYDKWHRSKK